MSSADPYKYFRVEAAELLERLGQAALANDRGESIEGGVPALLRYAHTLKGAARVVKQIAIAEQAHAIEDLLAPHRTSPEGLPRDCTSALLGYLDAITKLTVQLGVRDAKPTSTLSAEEAPRTLRADLADVDSVVDGLGESLVELESLEDVVGELERSRRASEVLVRQLAAPRRSESQKLGLVLERALRASEEIEAGLRRLGRSLQGGMEGLGRTLSEAHAGAERLRLIPVSGIFTMLERAVREAALELQKNIRFSSSGGDVRLESDVLVAAQSALLHVVRNSVAHGIERESERQRAGKPLQGLIELTVVRTGREVSFVCRDDGSGLDVSAARRALAHTGENVAGLAEDELLGLLLNARVSTSTRVTGLSGRGVGLDVVNATATRLGGHVRLSSRQGRGMTVELRLPLAMAAFHGAACEWDGRTLTLPLASVAEAMRVSRSDITSQSGSQSVRHAAQEIPFAPLGRVLGFADDADTRDVWSVIVVKSKDGSAAVGVDRLLGTRTTVLRPLPEAARVKPLVAGVSLDSLGNPELVLDPDELVAAVRAAAGVRQAPNAKSRPILVVDDSLTTRMLEQSILESAGYEVDLATSGEEGLVKAHERAYALFLVDVEMPGIDGFSFIDRARADPRLSGVPAVLVSSRSSPEDFARGKAVGARGYIVKERFDQRELLGLIRGLVGT